jgi:hypothetical protein
MIFVIVIIRWTNVPQCDPPVLIEGSVMRVTSAHPTEHDDCLGLP